MGTKSSREAHSRHRSHSSGSSSCSSRRIVSIGPANEHPANSRLQHTPTGSYSDRKPDATIDQCELLTEQLEAVLREPEKFSKHREKLGRLAHEVANLLEHCCLVDQLKEAIQEPQRFSKHQKELTRLARRISTVFDNPYQTYRRLAYSPLPLIVSRIGQERHLFETLAEHKHEKFGVHELAEKTGIKAIILDTFLQYMVAQGMIEEVDDHHYRANNVTINMMHPIIRNGIPLFNDLILPIFAAISDSLNEDFRRTAFQIAEATSLDFYSWLEGYPQWQRGVQQVLQHQWAFIPSWHCVVDFQSEFAPFADNQTFVFVDVGGGFGDQCTALLKKYPNLKGRVFLQDVPHRLRYARVPNRVSKMPYDPFEEQQIRGACVYYLRQLLHSNTDENVVRILKAQLPALGNDSVLLIDEKVFPDKKCDDHVNLLCVAELSILMVAFNNAFERRQSHWLMLLNEAGYEVAQIHPYSDLQDCIIVAKRKSRMGSNVSRISEFMDQNDTSLVRS